jgi:hypothetical protein
MSMDIIERLEDLNAKGTPIPWQCETEVYRHGEPHAIAVWNPVDGHCRVMSANANFYEQAKYDAEKARANTNALPALLAVVKAVVKLVQLRREDQSLEWLEKEMHAEQDLDEALAALREVKL